MHHLNKLCTYHLQARQNPFIMAKPKALLEAPATKALVAEVPAGRAATAAPVAAPLAVHTKPMVTAPAGPPTANPFTAPFTPEMTPPRIAPE